VNDTVGDNCDEAVAVSAPGLDTDLVDDSVIDPQLLDIADIISGIPHFCTLSGTDSRLFGKTSLSMRWSDISYVYKVPL
jgi:hypothetical protein